MKKKSALAFALALEKKGVDLYIRLAARTGNMLAKEVFYSLAKQEVDHAQRVDEIAVRQKTDGGWQQTVPVSLKNIETELKKFFKNAGQARLKKNAANIQGYETALKMERKSYNAYQQFAAAADGPAEKEFFLQLAAEENKHYETLANVYFYLTKNDEWVEEEESRVWNWMNQ
jgi:rubrerythrin